MTHSPATPSAPSPIDRLALAVATEPQRLHSSPMTGQTGAREDAMRFLLQTGADAGVRMIATRPGGDGERLLGQAWPFPSPFRVTVRTVSLNEGLDRVEAQARRSLERLGLPRGEALLVDNAADLAGAEGRALWDRLQSLKNRGLFRSIGFCATIEDGPALLARRLEADVVQVSCNLLDQRAAAEGVLDELKSVGAQVHLASVFAGGLLFAGGDDLPPHLANYAQVLSRTRRRLAERRCDPMQAALAYAFSLDAVDRVVASVASAAELRAILAAAHAPRPDLNWSELALEAPAAFAADARARISSAA
ncbi:aldo/keto reductase [Brevundimonas sp. SL130]|uniref:aldo/keto reductase n=1 Tax=Brevundimonas sp. SL130 TaxID=2995143 RepID=UPI00226CB86F|nr:aldo/keto reductase [Brevundimonas sp. SL130]WAC60033.1 aldo/keto reductase [Brevundimonas sp. SL130]